MSENYDVIVVGAGPGGSSSALGLARGGANVLLLDKFDFPRDKPCGDFIGRQAFKLTLKLGVPAARFAEYPPLTGIKMQTPSMRNLNMPGPRPGANSRVIPRTVFDNSLLELALEAGAHFKKAHAQELILQAGQAAGVKDKEGNIYLAPLVIGADGWSSIVARSMGLHLNGKGSTGVAVRAYFEGVKDLDNKVAFHFPKTILPGYGWLFPVGRDGCANVGLGLIAEEYSKNEKGNLGELFDRFIAQTPALARAEMVSPKRSWPLALGWQPNRPLRGPGTMLVGDAACLVGPLTGAGIYPSMRSGLVAAEVGLQALSQGDYSSAFLKAYEARVRREFRWRLTAEGKAQYWLRNPQNMDWALCNPLHLPISFSNAITTNLLFNLG
jgi:geranylgeranyl reductase family protein